MIRFSVAAAVFALLPSVSAALSCLPASVQSSYLWTQESKARYLILDGQFDFDQSLLPQRPVDNANAGDAVVTAQFTGRAFDGAGFKTPWSGNVTIMAGCSGPWCAHFVAGSSGIAFVQKIGSGYVLSLSPCGGQFFDSPTDQMRADIAQCHKGGDCTAPWK